MTVDLQTIGSSLLNDLTLVAMPLVAVAFVHPAAAEWVVAAWRWIIRITNAERRKEEL